MTEDPRQSSRIVDQFSQQAESYGKLTKNLSLKRRNQSFTTHLGLTGKDRALDICCGPGLLVLELARTVSHATGLDLTPSMLDEARRAQVLQGATNVSWIEGDAFRMPIESNTFTLVTCSAAFHHMTHPRRALAEMIRVCAPGGRIAVRDVTPLASKSGTYDRMERLRDPSHTHALTSDELAMLGEGLQVVGPEIYPTITPDLPLDAILATSFPTACTRGDLRAEFEDDANCGEDCLGFNARFVDGVLSVSYRQTTAVWHVV